MMHKMNALAHQCGENTAGVKMERWDAAERGKGSNTAITTQLISTGVTERISVTPSMFTQPGRGVSSKKGGESGKRERGFIGLYIGSCIFLQVFVHLWSCFKFYRPSDLKVQNRARKRCCTATTFVNKFTQHLSATLDFSLSQFRPFLFT